MKYLALKTRVHSYSKRILVGRFCPQKIHPKYFSKGAITSAAPILYCLGGFLIICILNKVWLNGFIFYMETM